MRGQPKRTPVHPTFGYNRAPHLKPLPEFGTRHGARQSSQINGLYWQWHLAAPLKGKGYFGQWQTDQGAISSSISGPGAIISWMPHRPVQPLVDSAGCRDADDARSRTIRQPDQFGDRRSLEAGSYLTADNEMTRKPNLALNAEIESSGRAANSPAVLVHFFRFAPTAIE